MPRGHMVRGAEAISTNARLLFNYGQSISRARLESIDNAMLSAVRCPFSGAYLPQTLTATKPGI